MDGSDFLKKFVAATGLPAEFVQDELLTLARKNGLTLENLSLDDFRVILADYLQDVLLKARDEFSA